MGLPIAQTTKAAALAIRITLWYTLKVRYRWDSRKDAANLRKHGVSFDQAQEALECGLVVVLKEDSDSMEDRYVYLGMCKKLNILVVVVAYPEDTVTRIISARKANKKERLFYEAQL